MNVLNLDHIKRMFNKGHLTVHTASFLHKMGYGIICRNGLVELICEEKDEMQA